ncbi:MAG: hypothetical protein WDM96_12190 [Lacunisphaera sp.]
MNIRGGKMVIESHPDETYVDLLEGDLTVRGSGGKDIGGQVLRPGERAIIRPSDVAGQPPSITIQPIPREALKADDERTSLACNARKSVTFEAMARKSGEGGGDGEAAGAGAGGDESDQQIVARPAVPAQSAGQRPGQSRPSVRHLTPMALSHRSIRRGLGVLFAGLVAATPTAPRAVEHRRDAQPALRLRRRHAGVQLQYLRPGRGRWRLRGDGQRPGPNSSARPASSASTQPRRSMSSVMAHIRTKTR